MYRLIAAITDLKKLLSAGEYAICRTDGEKMGLGDTMIVDYVFEEIDDAIEAIIDETTENIRKKRFVGRVA